MCVRERERERERESDKRQSFGRDAKPTSLVNCLTGTGLFNKYFPFIGYYLIVILPYKVLFYDSTEMQHLKKITHESFC